MSDDPHHTVFVTGATGYIGSRLVKGLLEDGHDVRALARQGSEGRVPSGCTAVIGDALDGSTYADKIAPAKTLIHLVGVAHPGPSKVPEFRSVDLASVRTMIPAALAAGIEHIIYVSVAHPAPVMRQYQEVRLECERLIRQSGISATFLRPFYVVGPGHYWILAFKPLYWLFGLLPATRATARRLATVTLAQMLAALRRSVLQPPAGGIRILNVPDIRAINP